MRSFETDPEWYRALAAKVTDNVQLSLIALAELEGAELEYQDEAWLLVDFAGKRTAFLDRFLAKRAASTRPAAIVLDNAEWYRRGAQLLTQQGYLEMPFYGFKSGQSWISCTSLFIDPARFAPRQKGPISHAGFFADDGQLLGPALNCVGNTVRKLSNESNAQ